MYKTTFGPRIQYVYALFFSIIMFSSWSAQGQTDPIVIDLENKVEPDCANDQTGILKISVSGGDGSYSFQWSGPNGFTSTSEDLSNIYWGNYTVKVTDGNLDTSEKSFTLQYNDNIPPVVRTTNISVSLNASGTATINVADIDNGSTDNCQITSKTLNKESFTCNDLGPQTVTLTIKDPEGNTGTGNATVTVKDEITPQITAPANVQADTDSNNCNASNVNLGSESTSDNCGIASVTNDAPSSFPLGQTIVTWTVTDNAGNTATDTQKIIISDNTNPTITAPADIQADTDANDCNASNVNLGTETKNDNCGIASVTNDAPSDFPLGETIVTWTVTDNAGNTATDTQKVVISDNTNPTITAPADIQADTDANDCNASSINLGTETKNDNCGIASVTNDAPSDFPLGETIVTWTVTDNAGNTATDTQKVIISDNTNPTITAPADIQADTDANDCNASSINLGTETKNDNCGIASVTNDAPSNFPLGETIVTWTVTDNAGNTATDTQKVIISDNTNPTITAPADIQADTDANDCNASNVNLGSETTNDNCGIALVENDAPAEFPLGETTVTWTVTDNSGNTATAIQKVVISDNTIPVITAGNDINATNDTGLCQAGLSIAPATATDNCSVSAPTGIRSDGLGLDEPYPVGITTIAWNVQDDNGNTADEVIQTVYVEDNEAPEVPVLEDITWGCEYTVKAPVSNDNCSGEVTATTTDPITYSNEGTYTINWNFTDNNGNSSSAIQKIIIDPVVVQTSKVDVLCNGFATGEVEASATGGVAPLTYDWGSLGSGATKTDLPAGTYSVTVTDANGCASDPIAVIIEEPDTFVDITGVQTTSGCFGQDNGTATVSVEGGVGNYTYLWDNDPNKTSKTATGFAPGSHSVTVTDENGCSKDRTFTVSQPTELKVTGFLTTETTSFGSSTGSATAQVSGGTPNYTFEWTGGPTGGTYTGQTAKDLAAGTYTVTVTDANGCIATESVVIVDSIEGNILPTSVCENTEDLIRVSTFSVEGGTAIGGSGIYEYSWDFGDGQGLRENIGPGPHRVEYNEIGDKQIKLVIKDSDGRHFEQTIIQYVGGCFSDDCGSSDLGVGDFYIGLDDENGTPVTSANCNSSESKYLYIKVPTSPKRYSLQVEIIYSIEDIETGEIINDKLIGCFYEYQDIPTNAKTFELNYNCKNNVEIKGIYLTFQVNKSRECGATQGKGNNPKCYSTNNEATVSSPLYGIAFPNELLCFGAENGRIEARASGGSGNYTYELVGPPDMEPVQDGNIFNGLGAGTYKVIIRDSNTNESYTTSEVEILQPAQPFEADIINQTNVSCYGGNDGSATVQAKGGTPDYIYVWPDGQTGPTATNLAAGEYEVNILDANGCETFITVTITEPGEIIPNAGPDQVLGCGFNSTQLEAEIDLDVDGNPISGIWTIVNGPAGGSFTDDAAPTTTFSGNQGTYTLRWSVDCGKSDDVKITFTNCSTLDFDGIDDYVNFGDNYGFTGGPFTFEAWIKPKSKDGSRTILSKKDISNPSGGFELKLTNGVPSIDGIGVSGLASNNVDTDRWYHIAVSFDGSTATLYVDGIPLGSKGNASNPGNTSAPFLLGAIYDSGAPNNPKNFFHGWMEEVRLWSKPLNKDQIRLLMNQHILDNAGAVQGEIIPIDAPDDLKWSDLQGYYRLDPIEISGGVTKDRATNKVSGKLINITTTQETTAPLPYISARNGVWWDENSWKEPQVWDSPNSTGINNEKIEWNIAVTSHTLKSNYKDIVMLGLLSKSGNSSILNMEGSVTNQTGNELFISHYLKLNGAIDLNGESQLVQPEGSILEETSTGYLDRDQQGTANSFNYNYWTSPVSLQN